MGGVHGSQSFVFRCGYALGVPLVRSVMCHAVIQKLHASEGELMG